MDYPITPPVARAADLHQLGCSDERHGVAEPHWGRCIWGIRTCTRQHLPMRTIYMGCLYQVLCSDADSHMYLKVDAGGGVCTEGGGGAGAWP